MLNGLLQDLRYSLRQLRKSPGFTAIIVLTLALGIGANTAIFTVVDFLLFRPLPILNPQQVVNLAYQQKRMGDGSSNGFSMPDFEDIRPQTTAFFSGMSAVAAFQMEGLTLNGENVNIWPAYVSENFFEVMGVKPQLGRFFQPSQGNSGVTDPVLVLSYSFWKTHFGGDRNVIGSTVSVSGRPVTIIGVAPEGFHGFSDIIESQGYLPLRLYTFGGRKDAWTDRDAGELLLVARIKDGFSFSQAQSGLNVIAARLAREYPKYHEGMALHAYRLHATGPDSGPPDRTVPLMSGVFLALAAAVLFLACLNVANLLLVRATVRQREIAMRAALGAGRARIVQQILIESGVLSLLGCIFGIGMGVIVARLIGSISTGSDLPLILDFRFDWRVFTYALGLAAVGALIVGAIPALRASGTKLGDLVHDSGRSVAAGRQRFRSALVVAQVAGSLMLLIVAGLFVRSLLNVQSTDLGFDPRHVMNFSMDPHEAGYQDEAGKVFYQSLLDRTRLLPGIRSASLAATVPMGYYSFGYQVKIPGRDPASVEGANINSVSTGYFETMQIPLLRGRDFSRTDVANSQGVAVVNQAMVDKYWPHQDPIGQQFTAVIGGKDRMLEIVGVAKNSRAESPSHAPGPYFYTALSQNYLSTETLQVRTVGAPQSSAQDILALVRELAPTLPVFDVQTMSDALKTINGLLLFQLGAVLAASMGTLGLILAIVGMYGVLSYATALRTHEIGIRVALGAKTRQVIGMILRQGLLIVSLGLALGTLAAVAMGRLVENLLVDVRGTDPLTYAVVLLLLAGVALFACFVPARRAPQVDPMVALRCD
ncbi:MAG TPA: ABC transporter permease [Candidatus Sulfotelmatobacter sp.]|nr:ABC transporter permease [Candidatus Sulfotelmatobacter sp.]